jgi:D-amino peptidase
MKVFISCDMEGISGVTGPDDIELGKDSYQRFREIMTGDVNAAIDGALLGGASEILVNDSHGKMRNILIEKLNPKAQLISGNTKPLFMMQGIDSSFDLAMFVGYHARAGTAAAVMNHTFQGIILQDVWINGTLVGETGINAGIAGCFGVPIGAVTGDDKIAEEATALLGNIETAVVKEGIDRYVAKCLPLVVSRDLIKNTARRAIERRKEFTPLKYPAPVQFKVRFTSTAEAELACALPMVTREDPRTVTVTADRYLEAFTLLMAVQFVAQRAFNDIFG